MAKLTLVLAVLLVALGVVGYVGTGSLHPTALIPAWIGLTLGIFGFLAISPSESRKIGAALKAKGVEFLDAPDRLRGDRFGRVGGRRPP